MVFTIVSLLGLLLCIMMIHNINYGNLNFYFSFMNNILVMYTNETVRLTWGDRNPLDIKEGLVLPQFVLDQEEIKYRKFTNTYKTGINKYYRGNPYI